ncbi:hypothetical protein EV356DRAFT_24715 [Viridothelium virens]|uniref:Uncharacterized protein n=1 Tax=Viridothelium virens TaxID=1048519 RepID=A0A6A6GTE1_VIRVR|nr:hypothetical protein EV356DRAFT_24715 [Viridothelium virens]
MIPFAVIRDNGNESYSVHSTAPNDQCTSWSSVPRIDPVATSHPGSTTGRSSSTSTARSFAERTCAADPDSTRTDGNGLEFVEEQVYCTSRLSPAPGPMNTRSSNRARGAKSWRPLDLTKIDDADIEPLNTTGASVGLEHREQSSGQAEFERTGGEALARSTQVWASSSLLPSTESPYADSNYHYNPSDQQRQSQSLAPKVPISITQGSTYGNHSGSTNFQLSTSHNRNEVLKVFGDSLPGPDYLQHNTGSLDGQVQFIQHPNGDVSAHQWTASLYQWTNLGQYSNTRKRIEGQLASDRIKAPARI